jgi:hypothetical protein
MEIETELRFVRTITLAGHGDCAILGALPDMSRIYLELYDTANEHVEQIGITQTGEIVAQGDQGVPLEPPPGVVRPRSAWTTMALNFAGARHRGIRAEERVDELAHPMSLPEKMQVAAHLKLEIPAPMILGWIESYSLAEATLNKGVFCVCRRLRIAFALPQKSHDTDGAPIDYDSAPLLLAHLYFANRHEDLPLADLLRHLPDATLHRPMDCMVVGGHLLVADGGDADQPARLHLWAISDDKSDTQERETSYA